MSEKIKRIESNIYKIPLNQNLTDSTHGIMTDFELVTVQIFLESNLYGTGYTYTVGTNGLGIHSIINSYLKKIILNEDFMNTEMLWRKMWWYLHYGGRGGAASMAISAVDIALWDLKSKYLNLPLWKLLGGNQNFVSCYAGGIDLFFNLENLFKQADSNLNKGFKAIKMKVGRDKLSDDIERVKLIRRHLGDDISLMLDANMKWSVEESIKASNALEQFNITWLEEPTIPEDIDGYRTIVKKSPIPIANGENFHSHYEFGNHIKANALSYAEPDVTACGGITSFLKIAHLTDCMNMKITSHGAHDVTVHLLSSVPNGFFLEAHGFALDEYIKSKLEIRDGNAICPNRLGHGLEFDWESLDKLKIP